MKVLLKKELLSLICSPVGLFFAAAFLLSAGLMNWLFEGSYNILLAGYASLEKFFSISSLLFIIFVPALTMRSFSEEKRNGNLNILRTRPVTMLWVHGSKLLAVWSIVLLVLVCSFVYLYTVYSLGNPVGNVDMHETIASYVMLSILALVFVSIGLFASSATSNQVVAFIIAIFLNFFAYYGFELLSYSVGNSLWQLKIASVGLFSHYENMRKAIFNVQDILVLFNYIVGFSISTVYLLSLKQKYDKRNFLISILFLLIVNFLFCFVPNKRFDFTSDKKYTLSNYTKKLLQDIKSLPETISIHVYLEGELNAGFQRLQNEIKSTLADYTYYSGGHVKVNFINPYSLEASQNELYASMEAKGMRGIVLNEVNREGRTSQKIIYPYAQVYQGEDTLTFNLLKNISGYTAEENLNASVESLEYEFTDALRLFIQPDPVDIAFIEGHGELPREYVYDAEELLSKYFYVNRGNIGYDISELDAFRVVIIAGTTERFTEREKYILDQYIMQGGRVLWLIDGVYLSQEELTINHQTAVIKNDTHLDDLLFNYGIRINPVLIQDVQCAQILLNAGEGGTESFVKVPWVYYPLLYPSLHHPITKDISFVKAEFASSIDVLTKRDVQKEILLTTSAHTHSLEIPNLVNFDLSEIPDTPEYYNESYLPIAVSLEGRFNSAFTNRMVPDSVLLSRNPYPQSIEASKMIVVSSSSVIRNEIAGNNENTQVLPMGYDRVSGTQFGNRDFILNAVNWLANDNEWLSLRTKQQQLRLLDRRRIAANYQQYALLNVILPFLLFCIIVVSIYMIRKRRYEK